MSWVNLHTNSGRSRGGVLRRRDRLPCAGYTHSFRMSVHSTTLGMLYLSSENYKFAFTHSKLVNHISYDSVWTQSISVDTVLIAWCILWCQSCVGLIFAIAICVPTLNHTTGYRGFIYENTRASYSVSQTKTPLSMTTNLTQPNSCLEAVRQSPVHIAMWNFWICEAILFKWG